MGLPATASAASDELYRSDDGLYDYYCTGGGTALLETYLGGGGDVTVPATVSSAASGTCDVKEIGVATYRDKGLTSVTISTTVTVYGAAFTGNAISTVAIAGPGAGYTSIPAGAFADQTVDGAPVIGWLDDRDFVVDDISGSFYDTSPAHFQAVTSERFTVSFDPRNGSEPVFDQHVFDGDLLDPPATPADPPIAGGDATGVEFAGWFTAGGERFDFGQPVTGDATLRAHWNYLYPDSWTITFEPENGRPATSVTAIDGATIDAPPRPDTAPPLDPGADAAVFVGWFASASGDAGPFDFSTPITSDLTLHAVWDQVTLDRHTVTFVPNDDGSTDPSFTVDVPDGDSVAEPPTPTPRPETSDTRWEFRTWTDEDGTPHDFSEPVTTDLVLTAGWTKITKRFVLTSTLASFSLPPTIGLAPGQTIDLTLKQFGNLPVPEHTADPTAILHPKNEINVSGCVTSRGSIRLAGTPDPAVTVVPVPNPDCATTTYATIRPAPYEGPVVPPVTIAKLGTYFGAQTARVSVESTPQFLGTMTFDEVGNGTLTVTLPDDLEAGRHTIVFDLDTGDELRYPITVGAADDALLPDTGSSQTSSLLASAAAMVMLGTAMVGVARRRRA